MTTPDSAQAQQVPPFDPGNMLLGEGPAQLTCALVPTDNGQRLVLTIRTASTTLSVLLTKADADQWAASIKATSSAMSGLILAGPGVPAGPGIGG